MPILGCIFKHSIALMFAVQAVIITNIFFVWINIPFWEQIQQIYISVNWKKNPSPILNWFYSLLTRKWALVVIKCGHSFKVIAIIWLSNCRYFQRFKHTATNPAQILNENPRNYYNCNFIFYILKIASV